MFLIQNMHIDDILFSASRPNLGTLELKRTVKLDSVWFLVIFLKKMWNMKW